MHNNNDLEVVSDFNYFGTVFNYTCSFVLNQETLADKGLKALNLLIILNLVYSVSWLMLSLVLHSTVALRYGVLT